MYLLFDTSRKETLVFLANKEKVFAQKKITGENRHSECLLSTIETILAANKISQKNLQGIAVILGPGSYTGLRVGLATANALAYGLEIPLAGLNIFEIALKNIKDHEKILLALEASANRFLTLDPGKDADKKENYQFFNLEEITRRKFGKILFIGSKDQESKVSFKKTPVDFFDYQAPKILASWLEIAKKRFKKNSKPLLPFYFQVAKITKKKIKS